MKNNTFFVGMLLAVVLFVALQQQLTYAVAILKFKVPKTTVAANQPLTVNGTSMAPNATATNCNVQIQTNMAGYQPVTPTGPSSGKYENWTATTPPLKEGVNSLEAQLLCFSPNAVNGQPSLTKHLVHNVTAISGPAPVPTTPTPANAPAIQQGGQ